MKILTERQYNAALNRAFWEGYKTGWANGEKNAVLHNNSINFIREKLGLPPIAKKER